MPGHRVDPPSDERDVAADDRDRAGDCRDSAGDQRDLEGGQRDVAGDERDDAGGRRDVAGRERDDAAADRDQRAERTEAKTAATGASRSAAAARRDAASDRKQASEDRLADAVQRSAANLDRHLAEADRIAGSAERTQAEADRGASSRDRTASAADRERACFDGLTGAYVRDPGLVELHRDVDRARRSGQPLIAAFIDVDRLKRTNDTRGHAAGDAMLREVARTLRAKLRPYDLIIRYGGDEFVCAVAGMARTDVEARFDQVRAALAAGHEPISVTVGLAELAADDTVEDVLARADDALYAQRRNDRGAPAPH